MDLNTSVILVGSNGQSFILQNDANILNSAACTEPSIITNLQSIQADSFAYNLNCTNVETADKDSLGANPQIVAILNENQAQTLEITSEQATQLGLQFDSNDLSQKKLILSSDDISTISVPPHQELSTQSGLFNTNYNLSIVNSPAVSTSSSTPFLESQFVDTSKKFSLEPVLTVSNTALQADCTESFLLEYGAKLNNKEVTPSLPESVSTNTPAEQQPIQNNLVRPEQSVYDSIFLKEPNYEEMCGATSLPDLVKSVKKKKVETKRPRDGIADVRKSLASLIRVPSPVHDKAVDKTSGNTSFTCENDKGSKLESTPSLEVPVCSPNVSKMSAVHNSSSVTKSSSVNSQSALKEPKKFKPGSASAKKQSSQESDERLDVTVNAQSLTKEQLNAIAQVFSNKQIMLDTKAPSKNVLYDPETNTRIICRVVYPEDLCKKKTADPVPFEGEKKDLEPNKILVKKRGRRSKLKDDEKSSTANKNETKTVPSSADKKVDESDQNLEKMLVALSRTTRSGRVSRPPRHMATNKIADETIPTPYQSVSSQPKPEPKTFAFLPDVVKKRNVSAEFKCPTCEKVYLGQAKMAMHFEKNPTHRNLEKWNEILQSLKKTDSKNTSEDAGSKAKCSTGKKKGKKRRTYEECKILLKKALEDCSKTDVASLAGPIVASVLSVWEFLVLRSAKVKSENENHVLALLRELKALLNQIKSSADALISPISCAQLDSHTETTNQIEIGDDTTSHVLGVPCGKYRVNSNYENNWLKSFSEGSKKLTENNTDSKRPRHEEDINLWPSSENPTQLPPTVPTETFDKGENDLNASNLLLPENNHSSTSYIDEIMSQRLENLRTQQQNELNDCFTSVDDLINDFSVAIGKKSEIIQNYPIDKCDTSLDLNFSFPRSELISDFQLMNDENRFAGSASEPGPCSSSLVNYPIDDSVYDNMSSMQDVISDDTDLMKSLVNFELRQNETLNFDSMNQFPLHENVTGASEFRVDGTGFDRVGQISSLVLPQGTKILKEDPRDELDFVHSLDCLNPSI
ncbi:unnamed protein product [Bemisia tabaci]|uniref:Uncharacterized protein n=1 Tax=Bemisia tabaci TaxID=7038 RepID=A0A9P0AAW6_BEMTA|nr:unnamed protein product [Bemisia tabaci]